MINRRNPRQVTLKNVHSSIIYIAGLPLNPGEQREYDCTVLDQTNIQLMLDKGLLQVMDEGQR